MKIIGIPLKSLRNSEFAQFISDALEIISRNDPTALKVQEIYDALKAQSDQLNLLLNPLKGSPLTIQLEAADDRRDAAVIGINLVVNGFSNHFDETTRQQAQILQQNLKIYGNASLARENYQSETADINSMLADWTNDSDLAGAIAALNLGDWQKELSQANQAFSDLYLNRNEEMSTSPQSVRSKRNEIIQSYYELRNMIDAYYTIQKSADPYGSTVDQINALIRKYNDLVGYHSTGNATTADAGTTDPAPTEQ